MAATIGTFRPAAGQAAARNVDRRALVVAAGATFMAYLDVTVVNVAFPDLEKSFPTTSIADLSWVVSAYAVLLAALLTPAGRVADLVGRRRLFVFGVLAFAAASTITALAPTVAVVIAARALQGAAAAVMIPSALALVLGFTRAERRIAAVGVWGAAGSLAAAAGPSIGGVLVQAAGWRAVFAINVPIGLALAFAARRGLPELCGDERRLPDLLGTALLAIGVAGLTAGLTKGSDWGWAAPATLAAIGGGLGLIAIALARSRRHPAPAVEATLWRNPVFSSASLTSLLFGGALFAWMLICPLFVYSFWHYSLLDAGLAVSPGAFTSAVAALAISRLETPELRRAACVVCALLLSAVGIWMYAGLPATPHFLSVWLPAGLIGGVGMGGVLTAVTSAAATSVPQARFAAGTGLVMTARQLGGGLGVAGAAAILAAGAPTPDRFRAVFLMCALASAGAAVAATRLAHRRRAPRLEAAQEAA